MRRLVVIVVGATAAAAVLGLSGSAALAQGSEEPTGTVESVVEADLGDAVESCDLSAEEIAEINAENEQLAAHLDGEGITYEWVEEDGIRFPEPVEDTDAAWDVIDDFFDELYGPSAEGI